MIQFRVLAWMLVELSVLRVMSIYVLEGSFGHVFESRKRL